MNMLTIIHIATAFGITAAVIAIGEGLGWRTALIGIVKSVLPPSLAPRGLNRVQAAAYVGVSPGLFDIMVEDGRMPQPKRINSRKVWDIRQLDMAFDALPNEGDGAANPWDAVAA